MIRSSATSRFFHFGVKAVLLSGLMAAQSTTIAQDKTTANTESTDSDRAVDHALIPGFERFHSQEAASSAEAGFLLLGELNCTSCHAGNEFAETRIQQKQAPILDDVGGRIRASYLREFLSSPHHAKPGTTMPNILAQVEPAQRQSQLEALVHFLATTGAVNDTTGDKKAAQRGDVLFHRVGCVACHQPQRPVTNPDKTSTTSVPLGNLPAKYTIASLTRFLRDPFHARPSGRMPNLNLSEQEARDIACYFFRDIEIPSNLEYAYYEGSWDDLPDFESLQPKVTGNVAGFDLQVAPRTSNYAIRFTGFLQIAHAGEYTFTIGSDDGSALAIDGRRVVASPGIHPYATQTRKTRLEPGAHPIVVDFFQGGGEWVLTLDFEGPETPKQPVAGAVTLTAAPVESSMDRFTVDPKLATTGKALFDSLKCAACHQLKAAGPQTATIAQPAVVALAKLNPDNGCLAQQPQANVPRFQLNDAQRMSIRAALQQLTGAAQPLTPAETIHRTLLTFNCFACHQRGERGGVEEWRNAFFATTIQEMGDEGRIPPRLDGVGDKLKDRWMQHVMSNGANDRPYMLTRMPKFGQANVGQLVNAFAESDRRQTAEIPEMSEPPHRVLAAGRFMVGDQALSCIKCHNFGPYKATGIQAMDLTTMTQRLRGDWFQRYMANPQEYRPGTRMPAAWPFGTSPLPDVLDGKADTQIRATWLYLRGGDKAAIPSGLVHGAIELIPEKTPIIYRNFITGLSPRGIAVGYPEKAHLAFDAEDLSLALIWHGAFIDASRHWVGRGPGSQAPLGDHVLSLVRGVPFAVLDDPQTTWPTGFTSDQGWKFAGYRLDAAQRPTFLYRSADIEVTDSPRPIAHEPDFGIERTLTIRADQPPERLYYRAAAGKTIEPQDDGWFLVDNALQVRVRSAEMRVPVVRPVQNGFELVVPVEFKDGMARIIQEYVW